MRIAVLCDVHGNLPALEAVFEEVEEIRPDAIVVGGDIASGPMPRETLGVVRSAGAHFVRGNADRVLDLDGIPEPNRSARLWVAERLGEERLEFLAGLPTDLVLDGIRFCHGAPGSDGIVITRVTPEERLRRLLDGVEERVVVCGHTHVQFDLSLDGTRVLNAGSVGAPYEAEPAAYWLFLGPEPEFRRTDYDVEGAREQMQATGYPNMEPYLEYLSPDPERPERLSRIIEEAAE